MDWLNFFDFLPDIESSPSSKSSKRIKRKEKSNSKEKLELKGIPSVLRPRLFNPENFTELENTPNEIKVKISE